MGFYNDEFLINKQDSESEDLILADRISPARMLLSNISDKGSFKNGLFETNAKSVSFSPDGMLLASGSQDNSICIWNLLEIKEEFRLSGHHSGVGCIIFSPKSDLLASSSLHKSIKVWNMVDKRLEFKLKSHTDNIQDLCFTPNGRFLISCSSDKLIKSGIS